MIDHISDNVCVVLGQSMKPFFESGEILAIKKVSPSFIQRGNVICYRRKSNGESIIHRVVKIINNNRDYIFVTKGDNLRVADGLVSDNQVEGLVFGRIIRGKILKISKFEELLALLFSPYLFIFRSYARKLLVILVNILYPYMCIVRVEDACSDNSECYYVWRGKKIVVLEKDTKRWVHPWFRRTPMINVVRYNEYIR